MDVVLTYIIGMVWWHNVLHIGSKIRILNQMTQLGRLGGKYEILEIQDK